MSSALTVLREHGVSELAYQFARFIDRKESGEQPMITLLAGLLSEAIQQGHVCLNLTSLELPAAFSKQEPLINEDIAQRLLSSKTAGRPGEYKPLIVTEQNQLYLYRYWLDEYDVAVAIKQRLEGVSDLNERQLNQDLADWVSSVSGTDWQKVAVAVAVSRRFAVISGGPGTGKTTIVLKMLQCLQHQSADLRVGLAAPTGKAAARLQQAISQQQQVDVKTLHRLLGITENNDRGRYHAERTLPLDVLIVDEASMIDVSLMAKLLRALPSKARLVLLGDSQQLASVESGAVLANLSEAEQGMFSAEFIHLFPDLGLQTAAENAALSDAFVRLQHSYRFDEHSLIGRLANSVNHGQVSSVMDLLQSQVEPVWQRPDEPMLEAHLVEKYQPFIEAVEHSVTNKDILSIFERFRVLAALKQGPQSVSSVNRMMMRVLAQRGWRTQQAYYSGRPIMITQNDYRQQLFNGDIGVILKDETGQLGACFCFDDALRWVKLNRLPAHETAFAMTIHKSQGSEFDAVSILLPEEISPVLNRELLYTAMTRARKSLFMLATEPVLRHTIQTQHQRESGLKWQIESLSD